MFCFKCGKEIPENSNFCSHCGIQQSSSTKEAMPSEPEIEIPTEMEVYLWSRGNVTARNEGSFLSAKKYISKPFSVLVIFRNDLTYVRCRGELVILLNRAVNNLISYESSRDKIARQSVLSGISNPFTSRYIGEFKEVFFELRLQLDGTEFKRIELQSGGVKQSVYGYRYVNDGTTPFGHMPGGIPTANAFAAADVVAHIVFQSRAGQALYARSNSLSNFEH